MISVRFTTRAAPSPLVRVGVPVGSLMFALVVGACVVAGTGSNAIDAYNTMFDASLRGWRPITRTLTLATPLILTGLAAVVAFRMRVWNIGAEGQLYIGAIAASGLALWLPAGSPRPAMLFVVIGGGALAGATWAALAAIPKAFLNTDEVITTLMLNFVALNLMNYLIFGTVSFWRDSERVTFPSGRRIPASAELPILSNRLHSGLLVALAAAALLWWALRRTTWGYEVRTIGDSPRASRYAGIGVKSKIISVLAISGGLAGIAGAVEVSGSTKALDPGALATDLGFTGIIVAAVARMNPPATIPVATLLAAIATSGSSLQASGVQVEVVFLLQGLIFLSVAAGEFFVANKVLFIADQRLEPSPLGASAGTTGHEANNE